MNIKDLRRLDTFALQLANKAVSDTEQLISKTSDNRRLDSPIIRGGINRPADFPSSGTAEPLDAGEVSSNSQQIIDPQFDVGTRSSFFAGHDFNSSSYIKDMLNKATGAGLTTAESINMMYEEYMSNTAYQRQVNDMRAAGVNPALLYDSGSSGATTPSVPGSSNGLDFGDLVQLLLLPMQLKQMQAGIANTNASALANKAAAGEATARALNLQQDTRNKSVEERSMQLELDFNQLIFDARKKSYDLGVEKQEVDIETAREHKKEIIENIKLLGAQAKTEQEKQFYYQMEADLADSRATEIETLLPFHRALLQAQEVATSKQGTMYMAAASLSTMQALQTKGLLQSGWIQKQIEELETRIRANSNEADYKEAMSQIAGVKAKLSSGKAITIDDIPKWRATDRVAAEIWNEFIQRAYEASTAITGPLAGVIAK